RRRYGCEIRGPPGRARARDRLEQAVRARRARRRQRASPGDRRLAAAADPVQRAGVRPAFPAERRSIGEVTEGFSEMSEPRRWFIRNIAEVPWKQFPDHFGGALSKPLVMPENAGTRHIDYRISMYQPMAHVKKHAHRVQEQVYHVLEGEGLMEI